MRFLACYFDRRLSCFDSILAPFIISILLFAKASFTASTAAVSFGDCPLYAETISAFKNSRIVLTGLFGDTIYFMNKTFIITTITKNLNTNAAQLDMFNATGFGVWNDIGNSLIYRKNVGNSKLQCSATISHSTKKRLLFLFNANWANQSTAMIETISCDIGMVTKTAISMNYSVSNDQISQIIGSWISSVELDTIYTITSGGLISKLTIDSPGSGGDGGQISIIKTLQICLSKSGLAVMWQENRTCETKINWPIKHGFFDGRSFYLFDDTQVYIFASDAYPWLYSFQNSSFSSSSSSSLSSSRTLFQSSTVVELKQKRIEDFFICSQSARTISPQTPIWQLALIAIVCVALIIAIVTIPYWIYRKYYAKTTSPAAPSPVASGSIVPDYSVTGDLADLKSQSAGSPPNTKMMMKENLRVYLDQPVDHQAKTCIDDSKEVAKDRRQLRKATSPGTVAGKRSTTRGVSTATSTSVNNARSVSTLKNRIARSRSLSKRLLSSGQRSSKNSLQSKKQNRKRLSGSRKQKSKNKTSNSDVSVGLQKNTNRVGASSSRVKMASSTTRQPQ